MDRSGRAEFDFDSAGQTHEVDLTGTEREQPVERFGQVHDPGWLLAFANTRRKIPLEHSHLNVFQSTAWWQPTNVKDLQQGQQPQIAVAERI